MDIGGVERDREEKIRFNLDFLILVGGVLLGFAAGIAKDSMPASVFEAAAIGSIAVAVPAFATMVIRSLRLGYI